MAKADAERRGIYRPEAVAAAPGHVAVEPIDYPRRTMEDTCWHDPRYAIGEWRCPLKRDRADLHRHVPVDLIELELPG